MSRPAVVHFDGFVVRSARGPWWLLACSANRPVDAFVTSAFGGRPVTCKRCAKMLAELGAEQAQAVIQ